MLDDNRLSNKENNASCVNSPISLGIVHPVVLLENVTSIIIAGARAKTF
jgi:hypothetical protein